MSQKEKIHTRAITVNSYELDGGVIEVEGILTDERFFPSFYYSRNQNIEPGTVHRMVVRFRVALPKLEITEAKAEMETVPMENCREIEACVLKLVGLRIRPGFTRKVRALLGRVQGCLHLTNLVLTMGSAAVQGFWAYFSRRREGASGVKAPEFDSNLLKNSCWLWREEGSLFARIRKLQEGGKTEDGAKDQS